jgi:hypothetical protein
MPAPVSRDGKASVFFDTNKLGQSLIEAIKQYWPSFDLIRVKKAPQPFVATHVAPTGFVPRGIQVNHTTAAPAANAASKPVATRQP